MICPFTVVFVGFQGVASPGCTLLNGSKKVRLFGEEIAVRAEMVSFCGLSSHADKDHLLAWVEYFSPKPRHIFVVHGDGKVTQIFADSLQEKGLEAHAPDYCEVYDLLDNKLLQTGITRKQQTEEEGIAPTGYLRLEQNLKRLMELVERNRGDSQDPGQLADQLKVFIDEWEAQNT